MKASFSQFQVQNSRRSITLLWLLPLLYMLIVGIYFVGRYEGRWAESDTASFTQYIRITAHGGSLISQNDATYPNGYAYQVISTFVLSLTGLSASSLQQLIYPLLACLVVLPAWLLYREWTDSALGATIATMLLFSQPEFLFVILRSSHEKVTRSLLLLCLYWLTRSFKLRNQPWSFAVYVGLFYVTTYALISSNNLLAHSFIFAVGCALMLMLMLQRRLAPERRESQISRRLPYAVMISLGIVYLFTFYAYPPAQHDLEVLRSIWDRIAALLLDVQTQRTNPYSTIQSGWISLPVYLTVSIADWIMLTISFVIWLRQGIRWLRKGELPQPQTALLVWLFYGAFATQGALTIVADVSGTLGGNLQHRIFSSFSIIAAGLIGIVAAKWIPNQARGLKRVVISVVLPCIAVLSVLKATNEPILSNKWTFYRSDELSALRWSDAYLQDSWIWTEFDERLTMAFITKGDDLFQGSSESANRNSFVGGNQIDKTHDFVVTELSRKRAVRMQQPFPVPSDALLVYDNGTAELYHTRPKTQYQK